MNPIIDNPELKQYFDSLPKAVQESIVQSGAKADTLEQLQQLADNFSGK